MKNNHDNNNPFASLSHNDNQCTLSYELLIVLQWLIDHEAPRLKKMILKGLANGLADQLQRQEAAPQNVDEMHDSIIEFFALLENILIEASNEQTMQQVLEKNLLPALDQIDSSICDDATVRFSIERATAKSTRKTGETAQQVLFRELLRNWKPHNKKELN